MDKKLRYIDVLGLVIGAIIGWGSFTLPGTKFLKEAGVINTFIGLLIGGVFIMVIQNGYHIMLENHREDGGEFTYALNHLGKGHGFVVGWSLSLCYLSMVPLNAGAFVLSIFHFGISNLSNGCTRDVCCYYFVWLHQYSRVKN